jgi:hypothetical protein
LDRLAFLTLLSWLLRYVLACRTRVMQATIPALHSLAAASLERYRQLAEQAPDFHLERRGWLYVYTDPGGLAAASQEPARSIRLAGGDGSAVAGCARS